MGAHRGPLVAGSRLQELGDLVAGIYGLEELAAAAETRAIPLEAVDTYAQAVADVLKGLERKLRDRGSS
jgi:hypothetical protein